MPAPIVSKTEVIGRLAEVFREHGFEGASLSAITAGTGLGKGSLYHYFPGGKEEMAAAVLRHIDGWFATNVFEPLGQGGDDAEAISAMFAGTRRYFHDGGRVCIVGVFALSSTRDRFAAQVESYFRRWVDALAGRLRRAGLEPEPSLRLAREAVAAIQGGLVLARALHDPSAFTDVIDRQERGLLQAIAEARALRA